MVVIGICGGTGSGKTTIATELTEKFDPNSIVLLAQDSYYKNLNELSFKERARVNYDHPDAVDFKLMIEHIKLLKSYKPVPKPVYDFTQHRRTCKVAYVKPAKILIVEGILIFVNPELRDLLDLKVFVDTDDDERLLRRIYRDMKERNRSIDSIQQQYLTTVKPMHLQYVLPSKKHADIFIPRGGGNIVAIAMLTSRLKVLINKNS